MKEAKLTSFHSFHLGKYQEKVDRRLEAWKERGFLRKIWAKDYSLWVSEPGPDIENRLGWLFLPKNMQGKLDGFATFAEEIRKEGIAHVILLGMGGSSLAPEVFQRIFGNREGYPDVTILDTTHPTAIRHRCDQLDLKNTLFLVSSKSGTTQETVSLFRFFWKEVNRVTESPGRHFVAITDPGTPLMKLAQERNFRMIFQTAPDVGGRFSVFTEFGLVPAALIGLDIHRLIERARKEMEGNSAGIPEKDASGVVLGAALGDIGMSRDKLTFLAPPSLSSFPDWLEQLIAESLGKDGKGILPVVDEPFISTEDYGEDRFFVALLLKGEEEKELQSRSAALHGKGHPVIDIMFDDRFDLGREMFRWEMAVPAAGSVLGVHPLNQPDVQLAKDLARKAMEGKKGAPGLNEDEFEEFSMDDPEAVAGALKAWLKTSQEGNYISLQAYLAPLPEIAESLQEIRRGLLARTHLATTLGFGPRYLHSTGQIHKGGPPSGLFLQIVDEPSEDLSIPETDYTFAALIKAQAIGDYQALRKRERRILRVNLRGDTKEGLEKLKEIIS